eukprot:28630_2
MRLDRVVKVFLEKLLFDLLVQETEPLVHLVLFLDFLRDQRIIASSSRVSVPHRGKIGNV